MNKHVMLKTILLITLIFTGGCSGLNLVPVQNPSERISSLGLSILPPQGENWHVIQNPPMGGVHYTKVMNGPTHTLSCFLMVVPINEDFIEPNEFLEYIKKAKELDTDPYRFKNVKAIYNLNERFGKFSLDYDMKATDIERKAANGNYLILKAFGYSFIHPESSNYSVEIGCSERGIAEDFTPSFSRVGKEFIDNLIIE